MLTKAILTGGVLSVLAGSIVYFGTEGADALVKDVHEDVRLDDTELAGAAEIVEELVHPHGTASSEPSVTEKKKAAAKAKAEAKARAEEAKAQAAEAKALAEKAEMQAAEAEAAETEAKDTQGENQVVESVAQAEPQDETDAVETPQAKPKTRWLDQYLKSDKARETEAKPADADTDAQEDAQESEEAILEVEDKVEVEVETVVEVETGQKMMAEIETETEAQAQAENVKTIEKKIVVEIDGDENFVWSSADEVELEMLEELLGESEITKDALKKEIRIIKLGDKGHGAKKHHHSSLSPIDYDAVLVEAKKLQVIDMRNEAFLEIVDYAIDRGDIGDAADIVDELSSPELRDTARARIGVGLATSGDMEAAFAVLDEIEIDELSAPIRLEIISALMATRAERAASQTLR